MELNLQEAFGTRYLAGDFVVVLAGTLTLEESRLLRADGITPRETAGGACLCVASIRGLLEWLDDVAKYGGNHALAINILNEISPICRESLKKFRVTNNKVTLA